MYAVASEVLVMQHAGQTQSFLPARSEVQGNRARHRLVKGMLCLLQLPPSMLNPEALAHCAIGELVYMCDSGPEHRGCCPSGLEHMPVLLLL